MSVSLLISGALAAGAFLITKCMIPSLSDMFVSANLFGHDMCKRDKPKVYVCNGFFRLTESVSRIYNGFFFPFCRPEAMGAVSGCIFLIALFLFIPVPFIFNNKQINEFPHNQVIGQHSRASLFMRQ